MKVTVVGPNLGDQNFTFHVHSADCADLKKRKYAHADGTGYAVEMASKQEVVEYIYDGQIFSDNAEDPVWGNWVAYAPDFKWFACADLPDTVEEVAT